MSRFFFQSNFLRKIGYKILNIYSQFNFDLKKNKVFVNSIPKAGTHLVKNILIDHLLYFDSYKHIDDNMINYGDNKIISLDKFKINNTKLLKILKSVKEGQVITAHLPFNKTILNSLIKNKFKIIYIKRDVEDQLISRLFYIKGLKRHFLHNSLMKNFKDDKSRIEALINGFKFNENQKIDSVNTILKNFKGWQKSNLVHTVNFEDLAINANKSRKIKSIKELIKYLKLDIKEINISKLIKNLKNTKSFTFRKGKKGEGKKILKKIYNKN